MAVADDDEARSVSVMTLRFSTPVVATIVATAVAWGIAWMTLRTDIDGKASIAEVHALQIQFDANAIKVQSQLDANTLLLRTIERRGLRFYCQAFPQSFECQPSEIP